MPTVWISFATEDNVNGDIDYLAQELSRNGWRSRLHPLFAGEDEKIERLMSALLSRPDQSDAWILYASARTIADGRLDRIRAALLRADEKRRGLPAIALNAGIPESELEALPLTYRIAIDDPQWRVRLGEALHLELPDEPAGGLQPYVARLLPDPTGTFAQILEVRPKIGRWDPFLFAVLPEEKDRVSPVLQPSARGTVPSAERASFNEGFSDDAEWYYVAGDQPATPLTSYYVFLRELPSRLAFGQLGAGEVFILNIRPKN